MKPIYLFLLLALALGGCTGDPMPVIRDGQGALTARLPSSTAPSLPTDTPPPTATPTHTPTMTPVPTGTPTPAFSPAEREAEEYAVYRSILDLNCVFSQTVDGGYINPDDYPELDPKLIEDYNSRREEIVSLNPDLLGRPVTLINSSQWNEFFSGSDVDEGWRLFYERTNCNGINKVSRVGFNAQMDKALVYFSGYVASLAGHFGVMLLSKGEEGEWHLERILSGGIS